MKVGEKVVVEEDTVVEWNGLERSACWIADEDGAGLLVPLVAGVNPWGERSDTAVSLVMES